MEAAGIVIEETGEVEGEIHADSITIKGHFTGKVMGGIVKLTADARVTGDIVYGSLSIERGAELNGECVPRAPGKTGPAQGQSSGSARE